MQYDEIINRLKAAANPANAAGMARYGISSTNTLGISIPSLRALAKEAGHDHELALLLWDSGIHEARILASFIEETEKVSADQLERWVADFDSWDVCDQVSDMIARTPHVFTKITEWAARDEEFIKRTAFSLIAEVSVHHKDLTDEEFEPFLTLIQDAADDGRNFVKKAVNWALRNIGKRNRALNRRAIAVAEEIRERGTKSARWIAADALRELQSEKVQERILEK